MGVAILLVYVMMVLTFNSLITPFIILFTLPLATIGAFPALYLSGRPIGVSALIGFLMLIGIVVTNAIVLLDLVERLRAEGHSTKDALIEGGRTRVRPILRRRRDGEARRWPPQTRRSTHRGRLTVGFARLGPVSDINPTHGQPRASVEILAHLLDRLDEEDLIHPGRDPDAG